MSNNLNDLTLKFGLREKNGLYFGEISRIKLLLRKENDSQFNIEIPINFSSSKTALYEYIDKETSEKTILSHEFTNESLFIQFNNDESKKKIPSSISELIKIINEIEHKETCAGCKNTGPSEFFSINDEVMNLCTPCKSAYEAKIEENLNTKSNYITGLIGALIGGLIGSILWIIIGYFNFLASIAGVAISYCAFKGYGFFNSKQTITGVIIVVCSILFSLLFAEYIGIFLQLLKEFPEITFKQYFLAFPDLLTEPEFVWSILPNLGLGLLFAGLGSYRTIKQNILNAKKLQNLKIEKI